MKKVMFTLCFMLGGIVVTAQEAQDTTSNQYRTETQSQNPQDGLAQDRERIQSTELPDEIKRSLESQEYRGWLVSGAFKAKASDQSAIESDTTSTDPNQPANAAVGAEGQEIFIVELKNGAETKTVRFNKDGQKIEGMEGEDQNSPSNEYNQNDQAPTAPAEQADPNSTPPGAPTPQSTPDQTETQHDQSTQPEQSTETKTDKPATEPNKSEQP